MLTIQKASLWKRASAFLFDAILMITVIVGIAIGISAMLGYDKLSGQLEDIRTEYEIKYEVDFDISQEDYEKFTQDQKDAYDAQFKEASEAYGKDAKARFIYAKMLSQTLLIVSLSSLVGFAMMSFVVPLFFKNGQTLGKKIFGVGVIRSNGVKASNFVLFARSILGKYTIETMFPAFIIILIYFGAMGIVGTVTIGLLLLLQMIALVKSKNNCAIHDLMVDTVVVDMATQRIFETQDALNEYLKEQQALEAMQAKYD